MKSFAAFDFDGTLIRWQLYHATVDKLANSGALGENAKEILKQSRMIWKRRETPEAFKNYEKTLIELYESALTDLPVKEFNKCVHLVTEEYKQQTYIYTRELIKKLKKQGYVLLAISGSHEELVQEIAKYYGFDDWVGTKYAHDNNRFTGKKFIASKNKKVILNKLIQKHNLSLKGSVAIGDSQSDINMLEIVEQPIAFNPDWSLYKKAKQQGWKIVIERKNVVYELDKKDDRYILV